MQNRRLPLFRRRGDREATARINEVRAGVFFIEGPAANWVILRDGTEFTLIDSGYPADSPRVLESIRTLGLQPHRAAAMLITHGHSDHIGSAARFMEEYGTPVLAAQLELPHLAGEEQHRVTVPEVLKEAGHPGTLRWLGHAIRAGGLKKNNVSRAEPWDAASLAELPGAPVAVPTPGHTPGHSSYVLSGGAVATGDAVVTGHPTSTTGGPQLLRPMFHHRPELVPVTLNALTGVKGTAMLPGHGPAMEGELAVLLAPLAK